MTTKYRNLLIIYGLMVLVILSRLIPHPVNFTPVGALGLFAGAFLARKIAWLIPLIVLFISDVLIGLYEPVSMLFVYLGFFSSTLIGHYFLSKRRSGLSLFGSSLGAAVIFFIFSNFGTWLSGTLYPMTLHGLVECYIMALPFFGNTLISTILYTFILFISIDYLNQRLDQNRTISAI